MMLMSLPSHKILLFYDIIYGFQMSAKTPLFYDIIHGFQMLVKLK